MAEWYIRGSSSSHQLISIDSDSFPPILIRSFSGWLWWLEQNRVDICVIYFFILQEWGHKAWSPSDGWKYMMAINFDILPFSKKWIHFSVSYASDSFSFFISKLWLESFLSLARAAAVAFALAGAGMLYYEHLNRFNWRQRYFDLEIVYEVYDDDDVAGMLYYEHLNRFNWQQNILI